FAFYMTYTCVAIKYIALVNILHEYFGTDSRDLRFRRDYCGGDCFERPVRVLQPPHTGSGGCPDPPDSFITGGFRGTYLAVNGYQCLIKMSRYYKCFKRQSKFVQRFHQMQQTHTVCYRSREFRM